MQWYLQKEGAIGRGRSHGQGHRLPDQAPIEPTTQSLIDKRRIIKAIDENDFSLVEPRQNHLLDQLCPTGIHQQEFGHGPHSQFFSGLFDDGAKCLSQSRSPGFPPLADHKALLLESLSQKGDLSGLATAFIAFEGKKESFVHFHEWILGVKRGPLRSATNHRLPR